MRYFTIPRNTLMSGCAIVALCIAPLIARAQSPADGQTPGAGINSTPGTSVLPSPVDQLGHMGGVNAGQQSAIDKIFLKKAIQGNLAEVQLGQLTLQKSNNAKVKQFAQTMIDDHTKLNDEMRQVALQMRVDPPSEPTKKDKSVISKMQGLSGTDYDQAYIRDMVKDHKQDLSEFKMEVSNGLDIGVKNVALQGTKAFQGHLDMAEQLAKEQNVDLAKK